MTAPIATASAGALLTRRQALALAGVAVPSALAAASLGGCSDDGADAPTTHDADEAGIDLVASDALAFEGSAAWCATMQICWDSLLDTLCDGRPLVPTNGDNQLVDALNDGSFDASMLSDDHYVSYAGPMTSEAREDIEDELRERLGQKSEILGDLDWSNPDELLFYSMLYRKFAFPTPFGVLEDGRWGADAQVTYFNVDDEDDRADDMRAQVHPLYYADAEHHAVRLDTKEGDQVVLVRSPEGDTMGAAWQAAQERAATADASQTAPLGWDDGFMCPNLAFSLRRSFDGLSGVRFDTADGDERQISMAVQTLRMTLDNEGGEVRSEAAVMASGAAAPTEEPRLFFYDGPFALFLVDGTAKADEPLPYLGLVVEDITRFV